MMNQRLTLIIQSEVTFASGMGKTYKRNSKYDKGYKTEPRDYETLTAFLHCKGGPMRDRRERRPNDARRIREQYQEHDYDD